MLHQRERHAAPARSLAPTVTGVSGAGFTGSLPEGGKNMQGAGSRIRPPVPPDLAAARQLQGAISMGKLQGKTAVITGATAGIGLAVARLFATEGAFVFITGRRQKELGDAVKEIGDNACGVQGDVASLADLDRLYETVGARGRIDVVVANAGVAGFTPLEAVTEEDFDRIFSTNVNSALFTAQKA